MAEADRPYEEVIPTLNYFHTQTALACVNDAPQNLPWSTFLQVSDDEVNKEDSAGSTHWLSTLSELSLPHMF